MKHTLLTLTTLIISLSASAQVDTVKVARNIKQVVVTHSKDGSMKVSLSGTDKDEDYRYSYSAFANEKSEKTDSLEPKLPMIEEKVKQKTWKPLWFEDVYFGQIFVTDDNPLDIKSWGHSWEIGISMFGVDYRPWQSRSHFSATVDFITRQYSTAKSDLLLQGNLPLTYAPAADGVHVKYNHITTGQLAVPVMYHQNIAKRLEFGLGAQLNWNFYSSASAKYTIDGDPMKYSTKIKGLNQRPFTVDLLATLGWSNYAHLYVRYSPMTVYKAEYGPELKSITFGIKFGL